MPVLPAVIRRMAGLDGDERPAAGGANFIVRDQFAFNDRAIVCRFNDARDETNWFVSRRWSQEFYGVIRGYGARRVIHSETLHQVIRGRPVAMAVQHGADDASAQHAGKRFLIGFCLKLGNHFIAIRKAANVQAFGVCRATTKTGEVGCVSFLYAFVH